ncbi:TLC domain-containing protein [Gorgonomyces haynaldii]|nr:TLC domain-containing protein [Gorgonomyces haynaldii]
MTLTKLNDHIVVLIASAIGYQILYLVAHVASELYEPYRRMPHTKQVSWAMHWCSMLNALLMTTLSIPILFDTQLQAQPLFGYSYYAGNVYALACGYFLWDTVYSIRNLSESGVGMVLHGIACFTVYLYSFTPYLQYFGSAFLLFEVSTIFLNVHWFCDKTGRSGSRLQWINGILLLLAFFSIRICFGLFMSYRFFGTLQTIIHYDSIPPFLFYLYGAANVFLNLLNLFWFTKMIRSVMSRFKKKQE